MAIHIKAKNKGLLHKKLGVAAGHKIPASKLNKAAKSKNVKLKREAIFAKNAKKWAKK